MLKDKKIILAVTGSIAAYKTPQLVRTLVKAGAHVKVIVTNDALQFVTTLSLATVSKNDVVTDLVKSDGQWQNHVSWGLWADALLIAPATANTIAKMANGICDNFLLATYLSARCPVFVAPAMDVDMYKHQSTQQNIAVLKARGTYILGPDDGELASGLHGFGRMLDEDSLTKALGLFFINNKKLCGLNIVITAGPTREAIDPVRYISNHSTGKMGVALADAAFNMGAEVTLILGKGALPINNKHYKVVYVDTAAQMLETSLLNFEKANVFIMAAAVADYKPAAPSNQKIKKKNADLNLLMEPTTDVLATLGKQKKNQTLVGFALETDNELENAKSKLKRKNLDFIVLNSMRDNGAGFATDTNKVTIIDTKGTILSLELKPKS
ncbi:MAG TPA: bifunctional phosphopantothenoylcysteine decarboxylase/phosphopantothenate--cysteine ligase CoaBC, partial [Bacteroidia bacterium]|nr:bifunctional phosphopantothenoylcysteine decarboxylase/phosphopantothenate--cysteine ligase CoaBC [Bacteroidia bacterium]